MAQRNRLLRVPSLKMHRIATLGFRKPVWRIVFFLAVVLAVRTDAFTGLTPSRTKPEQIHLSWGEDPRSMVRVMWQTPSPTPTHTVAYGTPPPLRIPAP